MELDLIKRLECSIDFINDGLTFTVNDFVLGKSANGRIFVNGYVGYSNINNISRSVILREFKEMKDDFTELMNSSKKFKEFADPIGIDFVLLFDTGTAAIKLCEEVDGIFRLLDII